MKRKWIKALAGIAVVMLAVLLSLMAYVSYNQKAILSEVIARLNQNIRGKLSIEKINLTIFSEFPNLSVTLQNGVVRDSATGQEIFRAGKIYCRINPFELLLKKVDVRSIILQNATIFLLQDSNGLNAKNIFIQSKDTTTGSLNISFNLKQLRVENLQLSFNDEVRNKHISVNAKELRGHVSQADSSFNVELQGPVHTDSLMFKADKGSFLFNQDADIDVHIAYNKLLHRLSIDPSFATIDQQKYAIEGYFLFAQKPAFMKLLITHHAVDFNKGRRILSAKILSKMKDIDVPTPVDVTVLIQGPILPDAPPQVDANFILKDGTINYYGARLTHVDMAGLFMNHVTPNVKNDDANSELVFQFTRANVNGVPLTAKASVVDLKALHAELSVAVNTPLTAFNQTLGADSTNFRFGSGTAVVNVNYRGTIYYYLDTIKSNFDDTLYGNVNIANGTFAYNKRGITLTNMQTDIAFTQRQIDLKHISCAINGNEVNMSGSVTSIRRIVTGEVEKMVGNLQVDAPKFDLNTVLVLKKSAQPVAPAAAMSPAQAGKITALLDTITNMLSLNLQVKCDQFIFRKLTATNVRGQINASSAGLSLSNFNLNMCQGSVTVNGALNTAQNNDRVNGAARINDIDVKQFLSSMDNFDQTAVKDNNLTGRLNAQVYFSSPLKANYNLVTDSMRGQINFSLKNGSLIDFDPIVNIGKKIFKNRDFKHVAFAEIKDTVDMHNNTFYFHKMEIASSVLRLFMQGRFSLSGACDLAIQVPLNNLKKQDIDYQPENIGIDAKAGPSIFLHVSGEKDKVKIALDPTARQRMKKGVSAKPI